MAEAHRFKKNREFKKRIGEEEENEEGDIRSFKFHHSFEDARDDRRFGGRDEHRFGDRRERKFGDRGARKFGDNVKSKFDADKGSSKFGAKRKRFNNNGKD